MTVIALLTINPGTVWVFARDGKPAPVGALSVTSDPAGAAVYVDGKFAGQTPVSVTQLAPGDHRVRVVKRGYLENGRIVSIDAGKASDLAVRLTRDSGSTETAARTSASSIQASTSDGGLLSNKWFWVAVAGGGTAAAVLLLGGNSAPNPGTVTPVPGTALQGAGVAFTAQGASDPDKDTLTYSWDFGDGGTGTGATPTHAYNSSGVFTVRVTVDDGHGHKPTATGSVTVKNLTGTWKGTLETVVPTTVTLTQVGTNVSGTFSDDLGILPAGTVTGFVSTTAPHVTLTVAIPGFAPFVFTGEAGPDVNSLNGSVNGSGFLNSPWSMTRR